MADLKKDFSNRCPTGHQVFVQSVAEALKFKIPPCAEMAILDDGSIAAVYDDPAGAHGVDPVSSFFMGETVSRLFAPRERLTFHPSGLLDRCKVSPGRPSVCKFGSWRAGSEVGTRMKRATKIIEEAEASRSAIHGGAIAETRPPVVARDESKIAIFGLWLASIVAQAIKKVQGSFSSAGQNEVMKADTAPVAHEAPEKPKRDDVEPWWYSSEVAAIFDNAQAPAPKVKDGDLGWEKRGKSKGTRNTSLEELAQSIDERSIARKFAEPPAGKKETLFIPKQTTDDMLLDHLRFREAHRDPCHGMTSRTCYVSAWDCTIVGTQTCMGGVWSSCSGCCSYEKRETRLENVPVSRKTYEPQCEMKKRYVTRSVPYWRYNKLEYTTRLDSEVERICTLAPVIRTTYELQNVPYINRGRHCR